MLKIWSIIMHTDDNLNKIIALGAINHATPCRLIPILESKANTLKQRPCKSTIDPCLDSMNESLLFILQLAPILAITSLVAHQSHLLISLLSLEGVILTVVLFVPYTIRIVGNPSATLTIILLTFGACEARLGLSLIVLMSRIHGSDIVKSLTINKC